MTYGEFISKAESEGVETSDSALMWRMFLLYSIALQKSVTKTEGAGIWDGDESVMPSDINGHCPCRSEAIRVALNKLKDYEDSGLTPENISELQEMFCSGHKGKFASLGMDKARVHARQLVKFYEKRRFDPREK